MNTHNEQFSVKPVYRKKLYRRRPSKKEMEWILSYKDKRKMRDTYTIYWKGHVFLADKPSLTLRKSTVEIAQSLSGKLRFMVRGRVIPMKDITDTYIPTAAEQRRAAKKKSREMIAQLKELYRLTKVTKVTKGKKSFMDKEIIGRLNEIVST